MLESLRGKLEEAGEDEGSEKNGQDLHKAATECNLVSETKQEVFIGFSFFSIFFCERFELIVFKLSSYPIH